MTPRELLEMIDEDLPEALLDKEMHCWVYGEPGKKWEIEKVTYGADGPFLRIKEVSTW
jgi:hypothetical protein